MTAKTAAKTTTTRKGGIGNTPASTGPVVPANLAGVVTEPTTPAKKVTAAELKATMDAKTAANAAKKAAAKTAAPKTSDKQAAAKAARDAAKAKTSAEVLAWLTARAGTCFSVKEVEIGTGNGPESDGVKTLRPTLWALVASGAILGHSDDAPLKNESGHKGFMVKATAPAKKAAPRKATTSK